MPQLGKSAFDVPLERGRIEGGVPRAQLGFCCFRNVRRIEHALVRSFRGVVVAAQVTADPFFFHEFHDGLEAIQIRPQGSAVERVEVIGRGGGLESLVADDFPHVGPVLLLDVRVVVAVHGSPAREVNFFLEAVGEQLPVDELGPIVRIEAAQGKRQTAPNALEGLQDALLGFPQDRLFFAPARGEIR